MASNRFESCRVLLYLITWLVIEMVKLIMQSIIQYEIDTDTNKVRILKKFTTPVKEARSLVKTKDKAEDSRAEIEEVVM